MFIVFSLGIGIMLGFILSFLFKIGDNNQTEAINYKNTNIILNMCNYIEAIIQNKSLSNNEKFINIMQIINCTHLSLTASTNKIYLDFINKLKLHELEKEDVAQKDQLTKAKEHINKLLCLLDDFAEDEIDSGGRDFMEQARQFLKEIEK